MNGLHSPRGEVAPAVFEPVVDVVGGQRLELVRTDERDEVGLGKALVVVDRFFRQSLGAPGEVRPLRLGRLRSPFPSVTSSMAPVYPFSSG